MRSTRRLLMSLALLVTALLALASRAQAEQGVLLVVTEVEGDAAGRFWWQRPQAPAWTATDVALRGLLGELGYEVIEPGASAEAPVISQRVFGRPHLSPANALNLASLYGASRLITGAVRYEQVTPALPLARVGVRVSVELHLYATGSTVELMPLRFEETVYGDDAARARAAALGRALGRMRALLKRSAGLLEAQVGVAIGEPVLVLTGLDHAAPLVEIKRALKAREDVDEVLELWASDGVIAVELNPEQRDDPSLLARAVDGLLMARFEGFVIQEVARDGDRVELMVLSRPAGEGR